MAGVAVLQAQTEVAGQASPMERLSLLFIQALQARIHGDLSGTGNLYGSGEPLSELIPITKSAIRQGRQALRLQAPFTLRSTRGMVHLHFGGAPILVTSAWAA